MNNWIVTRERTPESTVDYILHEAKRPIGIYVFGVDEIRSIVAEQVKEEFNTSTGASIRCTKSMFSIPMLQYNDIDIIIIDLPNTVSREYSSARGASGGKVDSLPNYGLRREVTDRLRKAGAETVVAVYARVNNHSHLRSLESVSCSDYLRRCRPEVDSPLSGDYLIVIEESASIL